jgi:hypothetical protein
MTLNSLSILRLHPLEEGSFIDQHAATAAADDFVKAIGLFVKYQVAKATQWWPLVMLVPFGHWNQAGFDGGIGIVHIMLRSVGCPAVLLDTEQPM